MANAHVCTRKMSHIAVLCCSSKRVRVRLSGMTLNCCSPVRAMERSIDSNPSATWGIVREAVCELEGTSRQMVCRRHRP